MTAAWWEKRDGEPTHWHNLDGYFKPIVTRFFITWFATAPLIASLIQNYPSIFVLPFDWWILWLASLAYAIAFALHAWKCPLFIKRYPTYPAYQARGHSPRWLVWEFHKCWNGIHAAGREKLKNRVVEKKYAIEVGKNPKFREKPQVLGAGTIFQFSYEGRSYDIAVKEDEKEDVVKDLFWEIFARWTSSGSKLRLIIWVLLIAAMVLVSLTVFQDIWFVVSLFWTKN
ncbi:hypothetical protein [Sulfitobacter pontiacus]|uniref:hypothetical protein n=1 Tax=Sulfitobacter pontiacus TaxID=60137 RepID=UPI0021A6D557|nr:hypothetical protein [Sulfitobacter pontiacus]UWR17812.1 hypothetical protein K3755_08885 [Sulfitobacter pontiacus]